MDELGRRLRDGMGREVGGWEPPLRVVPRAAPASGRAPWKVAVTLVAILVVVAGGIGAAMGLPGGGDPRRPASSLGEASLLPSVAPASQRTSPSPPATSVSVTPNPLFLAIPTPTASLASMPPRASLPVSPSAPPVTTTAPPVRCAKSNFTVTVRTDKASYSPGEPVRIGVSVRSAGACDTPGDYTIDGVVRLGGTVVEGFGAPAYCGLHNGVDPKCPAAIPGAPSHALRHWTPGETEAASDTWNQAVTGSTAAAPGSYAVVVTAGDVSASTRFAIAAASCTPDQLTVSLTADAASYAQGQSVRLTAMVTNTSTTACEAAVGNVADPTATDGSGRTVWQDCEGTGDIKQPDGSCLNDAVRRGGTELVAPGEGVLDLARRFTWDLGDQPAGVYTVSWAGYEGADNSPARLTVTVTG